jgi:hypothetical protein
LLTPSFGFLFDALARFLRGIKGALTVPPSNVITFQMHSGVAGEKEIRPGSMPRPEVTHYKPT